MEATINKTRKPGFMLGALVGALLTAPLLAFFFLADALLGLPLVPLDIIDWAARNLPGNLITAGIDAIVNTNEALNLGRTDQVAKIFEQFSGVAVLFIAGVIAGGVLYSILSGGVSRNRVELYGIIAGLFIGVPMALVNVSTNFTATTPPALNFVYIVAMFALWGWGLGAIYNRLTALAIKAEALASTGATPTARTASVEGIDRRSFLIRLGGASATLTIIGAGLGALLTRNPNTGVEVVEDTIDTATSGINGSNPNSAANRVERSVLNNDLEPAPGTRPEITPLQDHYRIDISARPPNIDGQMWTLPITGLVNNPLELTLDDIKAYESQDQWITLSCISNQVGGDLISTTKWTGVSLQKILEDLDVQPEGRYARITAADGFDEYMVLDMAYEDDRIMLCYAWDDQPLLQKHGFPLRIYIPDHYGMKQPKWITAIEIVPEWDEGYWVRRGWSASARVQTTSVIDTVATDAVYEGEDGAMYVPIGGIAYAGARGIARVEVKVNEGEWEEAELKTPISETTWTIWRYDWAFEEGVHMFAVRCIDGNGVPQTERRQGVRPDGATGIHTLGARL